MSKLSWLLALSLLAIAPAVAAQAPPPTPPAASADQPKGGDDTAQPVTHIRVTIPEGWLPVDDPEAPPGALIFAHPLGGVLLTGIVQTEDNDSTLKTIAKILEQSGGKMVGKPIINPDGTVIVAWQQRLAGRVAFKGRLAIGPLPGLGLDKPVRVFYRGDWLAKQDAQYGPLFNKVIKDGIFQVVP